MLEIRNENQKNQLNGFFGSWSDIATAIFRFAAAGELQKLQSVPIDEQKLFFDNHRRVLTGDDLAEIGADISASATNLLCSYGFLIFRTR